MLIRSSCTESFHVGHVAQVNGRAVVAADDQVAVTFRVVELALRPQQHRSARAVELSGAPVARAVADRGAQVVHGDAPRPHRGRVRLDADRRLGAEHVHAADARQDADPLADLRRPVVVELARRDRVARQRDVQDRLVVGVGLGKRRRRGQVHGEAAGRLRDGRLHVGGRGVDALVQRELQRQADVLPCVLLEVTTSRPLICMNCRSSGVAMLFAIVSGLAPG